MHIIMAFRTLLIILLTLGWMTSYGQGEVRDTAYWEAYDAAMVDRIWDAMDEPTYRELFDSLKVELATRLKNGPITESLAYRYHWISLRLKGRFPLEVKPYIDTAIQLRTQVGVPTADIAQSHYEKGKVLRLLGNDQGAHSFFEEGVRIMNQAILELDTTPDLAKRQAYFLIKAAWSAGYNGNFELARLRLKQIPLLLRKDTSSLSANTAYFSLVTEGDIEGLAGNDDKSIEIFQQILQLPYFKKVSSYNQATSRNNLGLKLLRSGLYEEADRQLSAAITIHEKGDRWIGLASSYINMIHLRVLQGRPQEALEFFELAKLAVAKTEGSNKGIVFGELYLYAALAAEQLGQTAQMEEYLAKTADALLADPQLYGPAQLPQIEGNTIYAQPTLLQFLSAKRDIFLNAYQRSDDANDLLLANATSRSIDTLMRLNRDQLNLTASLGQFISKEAEQYTTAVDVALQLYRRTGEVIYLNEAYQFVAGQKSNLLRRYLTSPGLAGTLGVPEAVIEEKKALDLQVLIVEKALQNASGAEETVLRDSLLRLNYHASRLKEEMGEDYPAFSKALRGYTAIDPATACASMPDDQLIVEYFLAADSIYAFTLSKSNGLNIITTARPDNLTDLIGSVVDQGAGATALYDLLVAPVLANRPAITRLQFIPDGELWKIPFSALKRGEDFLIQDYAISFAYAAPLLFDQELASQARAREEEYLGYGISYEDLQEDLSGSGLRSADHQDLRAMGQLPFASKEVQRAAELIGGEYRLNKDASLTNFIRESAGANILHLSMHGILRPNPMESALVFSGNEEEEFALLEMKDVLSGNYPAELTVLSACHTGGGSLQTSEGMQSIGRAFTAAGSRSTITSTWAARDESTHDILGLFFEELKDGAPKDIALQRAIKEYLAAGTAADRRPDHWANLTLTGIVAPIDTGFPWLLIALGLMTLVGLAFGVRRLTTKA